MELFGFAGKGLMEGWLCCSWQYRTNTGVEPVFVGIFFHVLLANPAHVHEISERDQGLL